MGRTGRNGQYASLRIAGRYRLIERLGTGGMSVVWRGYDEVLGRPVAVKVLSPQLAADQTFRDRLRQEALAAARLSHPHITGIFDFGEAPLSERLTVPYVVMELNDGESVAACLSRRGPLPWREAVTVATEVASALAAAHARGVVHRDVTPANVMLTPAGAKVVDFGISAIVGERDAAPDGSLLGTPAYLAPERLAGAQVTSATDVYALGLLLYRELTGRLPWPAETTAEALRAHLYAAPAPLPALPGMPPAVAELCLRCLAKTPTDRPAAADAARALAATVGLHPIVPPHRDRPADAPPPVRATAPASAAPTHPAPPRSPLAVSWLRISARLGLGRVRPLGLGRVRPLGGGLFAVMTRRGPQRTRHRLRAALVTAALVAVAGASWVTTREPAAVEQAQAAGAAPAARVPARGVCAVRYRLRRDSGSTYEAVLTVTATGEAARVPWRVQFTYPGTQRLTTAPRTVTQQGRTVVAKGSGRLRTFTLRGTYRGYNPLPLAFTLDGHSCRAEVVGTTTGRAGSQQISEPTAPQERPARGETKHDRPSRKGGERTSRARPAAPRPPSPPPAARTGTGFSLAL
jgi:serine/threonine-protein kinase